MDERSKKRFDEIVEKTPEELSEKDIGFLRARRSYLKKAQVEEFKSILDAKVENLSSDKETVKKNAKTKK
jgi:hypothetical protein|tara:strand:+ start:7388 stop:7597 length:210 start_codon:yes stop_codon:yes gene_type:complete